MTILGRGLLRVGAVVCVLAFAPSASGSLLDALADAGWRLAGASAALPTRRAVRQNWLEIQDFREFVYDDGALRLYASRVGDVVFAVLVDLRSRHRDVVPTRSDPRYRVFARHPYTVVVPRRPVEPAVFDELKKRTWRRSELVKLLGPPSNTYHVHGEGSFGLDFVPQALQFIAGRPRSGAIDPYQLYDPFNRRDWETFVRPFPPASLDARRLAPVVQRGWAKRLLKQRFTLDRALARGKRSPDGRFTAAIVNLGGAYNCEEIVIREGARPERRYAAFYYTSDADLAWLDDTRILHHLSQPSGDVEFYTVEARTGKRYFKMTIDYDAPQSVTGWGISAPGAFWYLTDDGERHEVRPSSRP